jgi:hypothetical protein
MDVYLMFMGFGWSMMLVVIWMQKSLPSFVMESGSAMELDLTSSLPSRAGSMKWALGLLIWPFGSLRKGFIPALRPGSSLGRKCQLFLGGNQYGFQKPFLVILLFYSLFFGMPFPPKRGCVLGVMVAVYSALFALVVQRVETIFSSLTASAEEFGWGFSLPAVLVSLCIIGLM